MIRAYGAAAVRAAEEPLLAAGVPLMRDAARALAIAAARAVRRPEAVLGLVGGGNNGGDALWALTELARRGISTRAALCASTVHAEGLAAARAAGVTIIPIVTDGDLDLPGLREAARRSRVWIDGLAGIGLRGALRDPLARVVATLNEARRMATREPFVIAVDVPSGVVDSGAVQGEIMRAHLTVTMGAAKPALLLPPACEAAGRVEVVELGLPLDPVTAAVRRLGAADVGELYPWPRRDDHKYTRGVVGVWAGSADYPGAAVLACAGALATGPGMVRYLGPVPSVPDHHPEVVTVPGRIQAALVGSGIAGPPGALAALAEAAGEGVPLVIDAGALEVLGRVPVRAPVIVTPHAGELAALTGVTRRAVDADPAAAAQRTATEWGVVVLLKGPVTVVAAPDGTLFSQDGVTAWLASAGSGDVLAGMLASMLAMLQARAEAAGAALGHAEVAAAGAAVSWLHSRAAARVSGADPTGSAGGPLTASRLAAAVPRLVAELPRQARNARVGESWS